MTRASLLLLFACASASLAAPSVEQQAPVRNFSLPFFNSQGERTALLRGDEVRALSPEEFQLAGLHYAQFEPPEPRPETVLLAPEARVVLVERQPVISGPQEVRLIRSDLEASGEDWRYDHARKNLSLGRAVRVVYNAELKDLLR
ncbi:hypothetical protein [Nibricoccus sp. IMCC34717]|uniref:hypothetical protein n=1 Tax=Nibricoccus sp. IMCC34717 TaxID=3034021 RepID=UPI00384F8674